MKNVLPSPRVLDRIRIPRRHGATAVPSRNAFYESACRFRIEGGGGGRCCGRPPRALRGVTRTGPGIVCVSECVCVCVWECARVCEAFLTRDIDSPGTLIARRAGQRRTPTSVFGHVYLPKVRSCAGSDPTGQVRRATFPFQCADTPCARSQGRREVGGVEALL